MQIYFYLRKNSYNMHYVPIFYLLLILHILHKYSIESQIFLTIKYNIIMKVMNYI